MEQKSLLLKNLSNKNFNLNEVVDFATNGLNINKNDILKNVDLEHVFNNMDYSDKLEFLKNKAISLTNMDNFFSSFNNLDWRFAASRFLLLDIYNRASKTNQREEIGYGSYYEFVEKAVFEEIYDKKIFDFYTKEDLVEMEKERRVEYDFDFDFAAMNIFSIRYLMKLKGEYFELPQDMYLTLALLLAAPEKKENRLKIAKEFYHSMGKRIISPATPIVLNLRRPEGNLASCFITAMDDDLTNIYYTLDQVAQISKNAGGVGLNMSRVRSQGAYIKKIKGASGGVCPWIRLINDTAVAVNQLGSRSGAVTVALDVWHKDIYEFLELQTENGDHRRKAFDIFPQIIVSDEFMRRVENNEDWTLFDPHEIKKKFGIDLPSLWGDEFSEIYRKLEESDIIEIRSTTNAKTLFKTFMKNLIETGMPYVFFKDTVNRLNPNKHSGMIGNCNLCCESFSNFSPSKVEKKELYGVNGVEITQKIDSGFVHTCNLVSLNLANFEDSFDFIEKYSNLATRMLDNTIEQTVAPLPESQRHNDLYRILGIGALGLADYLAKRKISYNKSENQVDELFEKIAYSCVKSSNQLAVERGVYNFYEGSDWSKGIFFGKDKNWFEENSKMNDKWKDLIEEVKKNGIRNGGLLAVAPNTSTSLIMGSTASVLPIYKKFFMDKSSKGTVPIVPTYMSQETFWNYKENQNINQNDVVKVCSKIQKWVDQGISMEWVINLKQGFKAKDLYDLYINAWKTNCKTVYYVRSIVKNASEETKGDDCISCSN